MEGGERGAALERERGASVRSAAGAALRTMEGRTDGSAGARLGVGAGALVSSQLAPKEPPGQMHLYKSSPPTVTHSAPRRHGRASQPSTSDSQRQPKNPEAQAQR